MECLWQSGDCVFQDTPPPPCPQRKAEGYRLWYASGGSSGKQGGAKRTGPKPVLYPQLTVSLSDSSPFYPVRFAAPRPLWDPLPPSSAPLVYPLTRCFALPSSGAPKGAGWTSTTRIEDAVFFDATSVAPTPGCL